MVSIIVRCIITVALLGSVRYSTNYRNADVLDPHPCLSLITNAHVLQGDSCLYRNVALRGDVIAHRFWIRGSNGVQVESADAKVVAVSGSPSGWTWRTYVLLLCALMPWALSLLAQTSIMARHVRKGRRN